MNSRSYAQAHTWSHEHIIALRDMIQRDICILQIHWYTMIQYPFFLHPPKIFARTHRNRSSTALSASWSAENYLHHCGKWILACWRIAWSPRKIPSNFMVYQFTPEIRWFFCFRKLEWSWVAIMLSQSPKFPHTPRSSALKWYYGWPWPSVLKPMVSSKFSELNPGFTQWIWDYNSTSVEDSSDTWCACQLSSTAEQLLSWGQKPLKVMICSWPRTTNTGIESQVWRRIKGIWYDLRSSQIKWNIRIATGNQPTNYIGHMWL